MKKLFLAVMILLPASLFGRHPFFYHLNLETRLPSNEVYDLVQDDFGYLWIGCDAGLFRYDGFNYRQYTSPLRNNISISNLAMRPGGELWCQNFSGQIFHKAPGTDSLSLAFDASTLSSNYPSFCLDSKGRAWLATDTSILVLDGTHQVIRQFSRAELQTGNHKWYDLETIDQDHVLAINYEGRLVTINIHDFRSRKLSLKLDDASRFFLFRLKERLILALEQNAGAGKTYRFYQVSATEATYLNRYQPPHPDQYVLKVAQAGDRIFLATTKGAFELDEQFALKEEEHSLFPTEKISSIMQDREGNTWFSSLQDGIFVVPNLDVEVFNQQNSPLADNSVSALYRENGSQLLIGTYAGNLYRLDFDRREIQPLFAQKTGPYRAVRKIERREGKLYVARGLFSIIAADGRVLDLPELRDSRDFLFRGDTLFYTRPDICGYLVREGNQWQNTVLRGKGGKALAATPDGQTIGILFTDGFYLYRDEKLTEMLYEGRPINGHCVGRVGDEIWIGTLDEGILSWDGQHMRQRFTSGNGLFDNEVKRFLVQDDHLYAATREGLSILNMTDGKAGYVNEFDGFAYKEVTGLVCEKGRMYLGTIKGLVSMPTSLATENPVPPSLRVDQLSLNGKPLPLTDRLEMDYSDVDLEISLSGTAFRSRGNYHYAYRMKELSDEWHEIPASQQKITFTSLPPNKYVLEVVAINEDGVRSEVETLAITVRSPFWQKIWFYLLLSLFIVLVFTLIFLLRLRYIRKKSDQKNRLIASQLTALKAQMNPHFMFNTLNSLQDLILRQDFERTNYYLSRYASLMRMILSNSEKEEISVEEEVKMLELYLQLEKLRFGDDFEYEIETKPEPDQFEGTVPSMIIQPYVENAIKHGLLHLKQRKKLRIEFVEGQEQVVCRITDNGVGRKKSAEINAKRRPNHQSFSTQATQKRIELLQNIRGGKYSVRTIDLEEDGKASGTQVVITFPRQAS